MNRKRWYSFQLLRKVADIGKRDRVLVSIVDKLNFCLVTSQGCNLASIPGAVFRVVNAVPLADYRCPLELARFGVRAPNDREEIILHFSQLGLVLLLVDPEIAGGC